jgi:hypothetical protein
MTLRVKALIASARAVSTFGWSTPGGLGIAEFPFGNAPAVSAF